MIVLSGYGGVNAQFDDFDKRAIDSGFEWLPESGDPLCDLYGSSISIVGNSNAEKAYNYFRTQGLTPTQAAAILGNLYVESRVDPTMVQGFTHFSTADEITNGGGGYGLAQWTHPTRKEQWIQFTTDKGWIDEIATLSPQLEWLWYEWGSHPNYGRQEFLDADGNDLRQLTWVFSSYYERPGAIEGHYATLTQPTSGDAVRSLNERDRAAQGFLDAYGENAVAGGSSNICVTGTENVDFSASGLRVDRSPPWDDGANCTGSFSEGANKLKEFVLDTWSPPVTGVGGYNCRTIVGNSSLTSIHGTGRAIDIFINATDPEGLAVGNQIRNWMISHSLDAGIQRVIWNRYSWVADRDGWVDYCKGGCTDEGGSKNPHEDHLHVEINNDAANMQLPWYEGR